MYIDGVQDTLPKNMMLWNIEYFKPKEFEKIDAEMTLCPSPEAGPKTLV